MRDWIGMIRRGLRKPPAVILDRLRSELRAEFERFRVPMRRRLKICVLLEEMGAPSVEALWSSLANRPFPAITSRAERYADDPRYAAHCASIMARAEKALAHRVALLGSGEVDLGATIDWHCDFKTGMAWPPRYFRDIEYNNPERPSDVKVPWELSRLQWLVPAGQAYMLTGEERYAAAVRAVLDGWIDANPYAGSVNWACTMEVALRILTWTWLFHVFHASSAWTCPAFREKFLCALYLHVEFTERHIERSDINGNHYTADAAGLVMGGLFFGAGDAAERWQHVGWDILLEEMGRQVHPDGVDFEASVPYHRLVTELFLLPALYRQKMQLPVDAGYRRRLEAMAFFTAAYSKPDGTAPLWGDADDARALPLGHQGINDHRYLIGIIGCAFGNPALLQHFSGPKDEVFWVLGEAACEALPATPVLLPSSAFPDGGFWVMRQRGDHVFIDCGAIGLAGRGGHGHNDCLAFEAVLDGVPLISDCGAFLYTASFSERNAFRSTAYHNTAQIDGEEINRFIRPDYLWNFHYDAVPRCLAWRADEAHALFVGEHAGYRRLASPITPRRTLLMDFETHGLFIGDEFDGGGLHDVSIPLHLSPGVEVSTCEAFTLLLRAGEKLFKVWWPADSGYELKVEDARISPSYGVVLVSKKLVWQRRNAPLAPLGVFICPVDRATDLESRVLSRLSPARK